ncbi:SdpI family protein [Paenibacillus agri]|uniref:SdpI family protein n=1 Tax=Paenibacillus agri TaxID=2744309 RepID=A0A850ENQ3_9BACL|nr:SdpI family protein [Paenibacillus agri]NUU61167.1 SdpI family protein [Paenibacillus agri]
MRNIKWKWQDTLIVVLGLASLCFALFNYNALPDQLPAQFGVTGEVNRYWSKDSAIACLGLLGLLMPLLMHFIRSIDPRKENYAKFENAYAMTRLAMALLFDFIFVLVIMYGLNINLPVGKIAIGAVGILFIIIGNYMPQVKDNYFIGLHTPWTLHNPEVWRKTHRLAGGLWVIGGLLMIGAIFTGGIWNTVVIVTALVLTTLIPVAYSWMLAQRLKV